MWLVHIKCLCLFSGAVLRAALLRNGGASNSARSRALLQQVLAMLRWRASVRRCAAFSAASAVGTGLLGRGKGGPPPESKTLRWSSTLIVRGVGGPPGSRYIRCVAWFWPWSRLLRGLGDVDGLTIIARSTPEGPHMVCSHVREPRLGARQRVGLKQSGVYQYSRGLPNFVQVCAWWIAQQMQNGMRCGVDDVRVHMRAFLRLTLIRSG